MKRLSALPLAAALAFAQTPELATVVSRSVSRTAELPGEIQPYMSVSLHAKVPGFIERVLIDRGSVVKEGDLLAELSAPEMAARLAEMRSRVETAQSDRLQAEAHLAAAEATYDSLKQAAQTPGAIAGNELVQAQKQVEAAAAVVRSREQAIGSVEASVHAEEALQAYLKITAPFDGIVTDRLIHPGALVGAAGSNPVLLILQQTSRLRLVVPVPEEDTGSNPTGARVTFHVPAYPERAFSGTVARIAHALEAKTRTMPVELDVTNRDGALAPGMYTTVQWPIRNSHAALFVPKTSVVSTTERQFVIRDQNGRAEWVDVKKGAAEGDLVVVMGDLRVGDKIVRRGTDELRPGAALR